MTSSPIAIARALHAALEAGKHGEALRPYFTSDAMTIERPNALKVAGAAMGLEETLRASMAGAANIAKQSYEVHSAVEQDSLAILRLTWTGEIARDIGPFQKGQVLKAHIAQFIETRDGRVARIETYDCYEPFGSSQSVAGRPAEQSTGTGDGHAL
jgi:ketosteroid isomerase-like protein